MHSDDPRREERPAGDRQPPADQQQAPSGHRPAPPPGQQPPGHGRPAPGTGGQPGLPPAAPPPQPHGRPGRAPLAPGQYGGPQPPAPHPPHDRPPQGRPGPQPQHGPTAPSAAQRPPGPQGPPAPQTPQPQHGPHPPGHPGSYGPRGPQAPPPAGPPAPHPHSGRPGAPNGPVGPPPPPGTPSFAPPPGPPPPPQTPAPVAEGSAHARRARPLWKRAQLPSIAVLLVALPTALGVPWWIERQDMLDRGVMPPEATAVPSSQETAELAGSTWEFRGGVVGELAGSPPPPEGTQLFDAVFTLTPGEGSAGKRLTGCEFRAVDGEGRWWQPTTTYSSRPGLEETVPVVYGCTDQNSKPLKAGKEVGIVVSFVVP